MKKLIVNADDFGYSFGMNRGIIEAHTDGIVTSTSVMVNSVAAAEAISLKDYPNLSVGLHYVAEGASDVIGELERQIEKFIEITGKQPTHVDVHKSSKDTRLRSILKEYTSERSIPYRYSGNHTLIKSFFGSSEELDLSIARLRKSLAETTGELNELVCHVGYADEYMMNHSSYNKPREQELHTMCSQDAKDLLAEFDLELTNWEK